VVILGGTACSRRDAVAPATVSAPSAAAAEKPATAASSPAAATPKAAASYPLKGEIVSVDVAKKILVVQHEAVEGYMPAMTMEFAVSPGDAAVAKPGQRIRAEMIPSKNGNFQLVKIWPDDKAGLETIAAGARVLREDTHNRGHGVYRDVGENAPEFTLYDQEGRVVQSARFRGKQVMLNFIFSRCPVATMCPASTMKMMRAQKLAREAAVSNVEFISITLDPTYDTPGVLKEYATIRDIDTSNFSFLTGPDSAIKDLLAQFGVIAEFDGDLLKHTLSTLLIDEQGKIVYRWENSDWDPKEFVARMKK